VSAQTAQLSFTRVRVTVDEASALDARACVAWYGAKTVADRTATTAVIQKRGDKSGVEDWTKLPLALERQRPRWMKSTVSMCCVGPYA
jgi:hypothetical protein